MQLKQAWEAFEQSGSIIDYLNYKMLEHQALLLHQTASQQATGEKELLDHADYDGRNYNSGQNPQ